MFGTLAFAGSAAAIAQTAGQPVQGEVQTHTGTPGAQEHTAFPPFDPSHYPSQLLWLAISFGLFYFVIAKIISPRLSGILETRQSRIASDLNEASKMAAEADAAVLAYEKDLATARAKANSIANEAREAAKAKSDEERKALDADLNTKILAAEANIAAIKAKALAEVGGIAEETLASVVELLTGVKISEAEAQKATAAQLSRAGVIQAASASATAKRPAVTPKPATSKLKADMLADAKLVSGK